MQNNYDVPSRVRAHRLLDLLTVHFIEFGKRSDVTLTPLDAEPRIVVPVAPLSVPWTGEEPIGRPSGVWVVVTL